MPEWPIVVVVDWSYFYSRGFRMGKDWPPMNKVLRGIILGEGQVGKILHF